MDSSAVKADPVDAEYDDFYAAHKVPSDEDARKALQARNAALEAENRALKDIIKQWNEVISGHKAVSDHFIDINRRLITELYASKERLDALEAALRESQECNMHLQAHAAGLTSALGKLMPRN